ncbi:type I DNA topoisomerase, partial [Oligoflexia bacterium]|nr:type I DNA topoisomerase [Oligoflexia bacterium]
KRMVFHEITKTAIQEALNSPRAIDENLVKAQETRRIIDRLFGYSVSPVLWKKMAPRLSAGRVQSVAIRLLVQRERERIKFIPSKYWDLKAVFSKIEGKGEFEADLTHVDDKRVATGKDFDPDTGKLKLTADVVLLDAAASNKLKSDLEQNTPTVTSITEKPFSTRPYAPFTTSTLQQEASRKLRFPARHTMSVAQQLYENGFITYMRTDSTNLSKEGMEAARGLIGKEFGNDYLHPEPRVYQTKVKNAQEAHEAIRPASSNFATVEAVRSKLGVEAAKLYEMIWKRTIASQMKDAKGIRVGVHVACGTALFRASGKTINFAGFLRAYVEGSDDPEAELADKEKILPVLSQGEALNAKTFDVLEHETQPPARYTEGSLIKELERLGIGRPSTWATIVGVVLNRSYAFKKGTALVPTFIANGVTNLMEAYFTDLVDYAFTARLEDDLDAIARGEADNLKYLNTFYFGNGHAGLKQLVETGETDIDPRIICGIPVGVAEDGRDLEVRIGRYGPFLSDGETRSSLPDGLAPDDLTVAKAVEILEAAARGPVAIGQHPEKDLPVYVKSGRFGPYVQLGDMEEGKDKPKMASLLPGMDPSEISLAVAVKLLELPKIIGANPDTKEDIVVSNGRYGPYIKCGTETRSIPLDNMSPIEMTLADAIALLKEPKRRGRGASQPKSLKEMGKHPVSEKELVIKSGRYGPYVTDGEINASLPKGTKPEELTMDEAVNLLAARAARVALMGDGKKPRGKAKAKTKAKTKAKSKAKAKTKAKAKAKTKSKTKTKTKAKAKTKTKAKSKTTSKTKSKSKK